VPLSSTAPPLGEVSIGGNGTGATSDADVPQVLVPNAATVDKLRSSSGLLQCDGQRRI